MIRVLSRHPSCVNVGCNTLWNMKHCNTVALSELRVYAIIWANINPFSILKRVKLNKIKSDIYCVYIYAHTQYKRCVCI